MKLAIGTVQFGINYGINNKNGIPSDFDISEGTIWSFAYLDGHTMESSGNQSASNGDFVNLIIPVYNSNVSSDNSSWKRASNAAVVAI